MGEINPFPGPYTHQRVLNKYVGLVIGKNGETVRNLHQKTGCFIFIPKESKHMEDFRVIELSGNSESIQNCVNEIEALIAQATTNSNECHNFDPNYLNPQNQYMQQQYGINLLSQSAFNNCKFYFFILDYYNNTVNDLLSGKFNPVTSLNTTPSNGTNILQSFTNLFNNSSTLPMINPYMNNAQSKININLINSNNYNYSAMNNFNTQIPGGYYNNGSLPNYGVNMNQGMQFQQNHGYPPTNMGMNYPNNNFNNMLNYYNNMSRFSQQQQNNNSNNNQNQMINQQNKVTVPTNLQQESIKDDKQNLKKKDDGVKKKSMLNYIYGGQVI